MDERAEILHLLKYGRAEEVAAYFRKKEKKQYADSFVPFMDQMIREHKVSRKQIALSSGLSQDYTYKLLRLDKHTDERDYILAICFGIGMSLAQTQHALDLYGMPQLSEDDIRSRIIILALEEEYDIDRCNDLLEKAGYPLIRTSPDMPSAPITRSSVRNGPMERVKREFEEIDAYTDGHRNDGNAPFDYDYQGWIRLQDEAGEIYQVEAVFSVFGDSFIVFTDEQRKIAEQKMQKACEAKKAFFRRHPDIEGQDMSVLMEHPELWDEWMEASSAGSDAPMLEHYDTLEDAAHSEFFPFFLELDRRTDQKVLEILEKIDDTRNYKNGRMGLAWHGQQMMYIEVFNDAQPERQEYYQLMEYVDGRKRYTASHESMFMRMEMGEELYRCYFGEKRKPEFFLDRSENDFPDQQVQLIFRSLQARLHMQALQSGFPEVNQDEVEDEQIALAIEHGTGMIWSDTDAAVSMLTDALGMVEKRSLHETKNLRMYTEICCRLAQAAEIGDMDEEENRWYTRVMEKKDALIASDDPVCLSWLIVAEMSLIPLEQESLQHLRFLLDLIEQHGACADDYARQAVLYGRYAFYMEDQAPEAAMEAYRHSLKLVRDHQIDRMPPMAQFVASDTFNFGWFLWNVMDSDESIYYATRVLDILEGYRANKVIVPRFLSPEYIRMLMKKTGYLLEEIYQDKNMEKDYERLIDRLAESGVNLEDED